MNLPSLPPFVRLMSETNHVKYYSYSFFILIDLHFPLNLIKSISYSPLSSFPFFLLNLSSSRYSYISCFLKVSFLIQHTLTLVFCPTRFPFLFLPFYCFPLPLIFPPTIILFLFSSLLLYYSASCLPSYSITLPLVFPPTL